MNEYLLILRGGEDIRALKSPEEMQQHMQKWHHWFTSMANDGVFVAGQPLQQEAKSLINMGKQVIDRPLAEGKEMVGGYIIVRASNLDDATELAKGCPGFEHDCTIEVREIMSLG